MRIIYLTIGLIIILYTFAYSAECNSGVYPDKKCTPGVIRKETTLIDICTNGFTATIRNVPSSIKKEVFRKYGMNQKEKPCPCEVDHFVSLVLGGSNEIENLWPESYSGQYNAREKDKLENFYHKQICKGNITPGQAQKEITEDWVKYYKHYGLDHRGNEGNMEANEE